MRFAYPPGDSALRLELVEHVAGDGAGDAAEDGAREGGDDGLDGFRHQVGEAVDDAGHGAVVGLLAAGGLGLQGLHLLQGFGLLLRRCLPGDGGEQGREGGFQFLGP